MKRLLASSFLIAASVALSAAQNPRDIGVLATPAGITIEPLGVSQGYEWNKQTATFLPREQIAFATPTGMTLYTYDSDPPGKATCAGACREEFHPALAGADAKASGDWSLIKREGGVRQWAYKGKALYTCAKDMDPGSVYGNSPARFGMKRRNAAGQLVGSDGYGPRAKDVPLPAGWHVALIYPVSGLTLPATLAVKEVADAQAIVLVDHRGMTIYAADKPLSSDQWTPVDAAQLSDPIGDFNFIVRDDGVKQWTYKGKALFTYAGDLAQGDANGIGVDKRLEVAAVLRYFMPRDVTVERTLGQGKVLATAAGKTLYRREAHIDQTGGGHGLRRGQPLRPAVGRDLGIANVHCDDACRKVWHPYAAPADAKPQGQWTVATYPDGFRQWVYQGYSLWTYDGDKKPGDMTGNDDEVYTFAGMPGMAGPVTKEFIDIGTPQDGGAGLYWAIAIP